MRNIDLVGAYINEIGYYEILEKKKETKKIRHRTIEEINEYMEETSEGKLNLEGREKLKSYLIDFEKQRQESAENLEIEGAKKV